ncbi:hypothetical protein AKJ37_02260 [candidate division MSBL1 archaeon SCGC-AAA259I09]|uniref:Branched-chain amino acid ABC transporter permease n=1 Tax=candidate division MSBL1 archaeon SCGC-AAA259I09 TaxID=1698267 RepID=A0A133UUJ1_9EURY|nr:hypothetical protein AKJ37_02260 [candidate division MSBL1 archaeon SCGC-AAA259I09]
MAAIQLWIMLLFSGLSTGGLYAIVALGLNLVYGVTGVLNLAHGEFVMLAGLATFLLAPILNISVLLLIPLLLIIFFLFGILIERSLIRPIIRRPSGKILSISILVTLGLSFVLRDVTFSYIYSGNFGVPINLPSLKISGASISSIDIIILVLAVSFSLTFFLFLRKTLMGKAIRALLQNKEGAKYVGINPEKISQITFGLGGSLAALGGWSLVAITQLNPFVGMAYTIKATAIIILGGLGSFGGALLGGFILGVAESFTGYYIGPGWMPSIAYILLLIILIIRPQGLFGYER